MSFPSKVVIVGGCGHVGLPLGIVLASKGRHDVTLLDIDRAKIEAINAARMPFLEAGAPALLRDLIGKKLRATLDAGCLRQADIVITVIGTPVDAHLNPTVNDLYRTVDKLCTQMRPASLLILRSTVYPGVTQLVHDRIQARGSDIQVAFCPERITQGNAIEELTKLPQIVAAFRAEALDRARQLFLSITPTIIELEPLEAELAKLFTNSWRYLNFAVANQFYMLAETYGLDFYRIHDAVTREYPRMGSFARAGFAAGPCLLKDTLQLSAFASNNFFLGHAAMLINEGLPNFLVGQLRDHDLRNRTVAILGMGFKAESDDRRDSLSYKLKKLLEVESREVLCADPYVCDPSLIAVEEAIRRADILILGVPHKAYRKLEIPSGKLTVDVWGVWPTNQSWRQQAGAKASAVRL